MMIHEVTEKAGAHKRRKRVGRGIGSGHGKTCGRGHKGAGSRSGSKRRARFEGGQMPFFRRIPKRGFTNAQYATVWQSINVKALEASFADGAVVDPLTLREHGLISDVRIPVKILGEGTLTRKLNVKVAGFSKSASDKITAAGGSAEVEAAPRRRSDLEAASETSA